MNSASGKRGRPILLLDSDLLGLAAAALVGGVVMAVGSFVQELDGFTVAVRVGISFVVTYVLVFLFVKLLLHTLVAELAERRRREREEAAREAESAHPESRGGE